MQLILYINGNKIADYFFVIRSRFKMNLKNQYVYLEKISNRNNEYFTKKKCEEVSCKKHDFFRAMKKREKKKVQSIFMER